jgi:hypothetical protein
MLDGLHPSARFELFDSRSFEYPTEKTAGTTGLPHMYGHGVSEEEVEEILARPIDSRRG